LNPRGLESDCWGGGNLEKVSHTAQGKQEGDKENTLYSLLISRAFANARGERRRERARARERERERVERVRERFPLCPLHSPLSTLNTHVYRN